MNKNLTFNNCQRFVIEEEKRKNKEQRLDQTLNSLIIGGRVIAAFATAAAGAAESEIKKNGEP